MSFTLRISMTGLLLLAQDSDEVHVLFPRSGYDNGGDHVEPHTPKIIYDKAYSRPNSQTTDGDCDWQKLDGVIDWTAISGDTPNASVPSSVFDLNKVTGQTFPRSILVGNSNGNLVARVSLHHGSFTCYEHGHSFAVKNNPHEGSWFAKWTMHGIQDTQLPISTQPLVGSGNSPLLTLYPIHKSINIILASVPDGDAPPQPNIGDPIPHFRAIYDLLRLPTTLPVPVFAGNNHPHRRCIHPCEPRGHIRLFNDAFQCFPGGATLT